LHKEVQDQVDELACVVLFLYRGLILTRTVFYEALREKVASLGGYHNAHLHLDRSHTLGRVDATTPDNAAHLTLSKKHSLISDIHQGVLYTTANLTARLNESLDEMVACNTRRADSVIDVTADGLGLRALETAKAVSKARSKEIDFRVAVYSPLGFRDDAPERWDLIEQGAKMADFIGCLPERDDTTDYPDHIGYEHSCRRMLDLAARTGLEIQLHTDQVNHPNERGTEQLLDVIEADGITLGSTDAPKIWVVHMISPATYTEARWSKLVARMRDANIGVICCPSAAVGMRQIRGMMTPTANSIARVLDLCASGIHVRLGSDNLADMLSPSTTANLTDEVFMLSAALRFYDIEVLAKLACGHPLNKDNIQTVQQHLEADHVEMAKAMRRWGPVSAP
jgi:cytosine/adenosine deaminase-related metal-dependent hydrolase